MARRTPVDWGSYAIVAVIAFAIGRCTVEPTPPAAPLIVQAPSLPTAELPPPAPAEPAAAAAVDPVADHAAQVPTALYSSPVRAEAVLAEPAASRFTCSGKRLCREMDSCEEANFYLSTCGVGRLDGDGDGVPCESICG